MKYTFDEKIPYEFKDVTGLSQEDRVGGHSIIEEGKIIGGILTRTQYLQFGEIIAKTKIINIVGIEILPEYRNRGKGEAIIRELLLTHDCIHAAVQEEKAWKWWQKMGA